MNSPFRLACAVLFAATGLLVTAEASSAMPAAAPQQGGHALVQDVRWGCGPGRHPNPWGRCVPDRRPRAYYGGGWRGDGYRHDRGWHGGWHRDDRRGGPMHGDRRIIRQ
ncbi:GCG_CRPN prefix-to-repeats domain-containing protein [Labrys monachus]|uniref:Uncharacterized protein n=1 Tax=Labrys monachus TaxID=217067 RepID=A0ABU0FE80_9HYPH|nr:hypothetical protein [Labrys monachus]MDQ0392433.1 hypothetical protein [Labrys monachus]